jgi:dTDP-4-dehydrorhamnose 3,5-epimerase
MIDGIILTPLSIIKTPCGDVLHAMKKNDHGFNGYGEAYFSEIKSQAIKAWKRHKKMTLNLIVPMGAIRFVLFDDRRNEQGKIWQVVLSKDNYQRLTIPPMVWVGFQGMSNSNSMLLNIANIAHSPDEANIKDIKEIEFNWEE